MYCQNCRTTEESLLHVNSTNKYGKKYYMCRDCSRVRNKVYYNTPRGKESVKRKNTKRLERYPNRQKEVWYPAQKIPRKPCELCGDYPTHRHHPDYSKPLEVIFLCPSHHKRLHEVLSVEG